MISGLVANQLSASGAVALLKFTVNDYFGKPHLYTGC